MAARKRELNFEPPMVWLGQSVDTSSICSRYSELSRSPFLTSLGCAIRKPSLKKTHFHLDLKGKLGLTGLLMVDSGGFALSTAPTSTWTAVDVAQAIGKIDADIFVSLDYPPGAGDSAVMRTKKIKASMRNFARLARKFTNKTIMPVVHGRTISEIELSIRLLASQACNPKWIGLGGMVPLLQHRQTSSEIAAMTPEVFIGVALSLVRKEFPRSRLHVFGAGGPRTFPAVYALGADSGDSIGWRQAAGFGSIFLPLRSQRVVKWSAGTAPPRKTLTRSDLDQLQLCRCPICEDKPTIALKLEAFKDSYYDRSIHNAWVVAYQSVFWPKKRSALFAEVASGSFGSAWARAAQWVSR